MKSLIALVFTISSFSLQARTDEEITQICQDNLYQHTETLSASYPHCERQWPRTEDGGFPYPLIGCLMQNCQAAMKNDPTLVAEQFRVENAPVVTASDTQSPDSTTTTETGTSEQQQPTAEAAEQTQQFANNLIDQRVEFIPGLREFESFGEMRDDEAVRIGSVMDYEAWQNYFSEVESGARAIEGPGNAFMKSCQGLWGWEEWHNDRKIREVSHTAELAWGPLSSELENAVASQVNDDRMQKTRAWQQLLKKAKKKMEYEVLSSASAVAASKAAFETLPDPASYMASCIPDATSPPVMDLTHGIQRFTGCTLKPASPTPPANPALPGIIQVGLTQIQTGVEAVITSVSNAHAKAVMKGLHMLNMQRKCGASMLFMHLSETDDTPPMTSMDGRITCKGYGLMTQDYEGCRGFVEAYDANVLAEGVAQGLQQVGSMIGAQKDYSEKVAGKTDDALAGHKFQQSAIKRQANYAKQRAVLDGVKFVTLLMSQKNIPKAYDIQERARMHWVDINQGQFGMANFEWYVNELAKFRKQLENSTNYQGPYLNGSNWGDYARVKSAYAQLVARSKVTPTPPAPVVKTWSNPFKNFSWKSFFNPLKQAFAQAGLFQAAKIASQFQDVADANAVTAHETNVFEANRAQLGIAKSECEKTAENKDLSTAELAAAKEKCLADYQTKLAEMAAAEAKQKELQAQNEAKAAEIVTKENLSRENNRPLRAVVPMEFPSLNAQENAMFDLAFLGGDGSQLMLADFLLDNIEGTFADGDTFIERQWNGRGHNSGRANVLVMNQEVIEIAKKLLMESGIKGLAELAKGLMFDKHANDLGDQINAAEAYDPEGNPISYVGGQQFGEGGLIAFCQGDPNHPACAGLENGTLETPGFGDFNGGFQFGGTGRNSVIDPNQSLSESDTDKNAVNNPGSALGKGLGGGAIGKKAVPKGFENANVARAAFKQKGRGGGGGGGGAGSSSAPGGLGGGGGQTVAKYKGPIKSSGTYGKGVSKGFYSKGGGLKRGTSGKKVANPFDKMFAKGQGKNGEILSFRGPSSLKGKGGLFDRISNAYSKAESQKRFLFYKVGKKK